MDTEAPQKFTGELSDFQNMPRVTLTKEYYDALARAVLLAEERMKLKDKLYGLEKDLEKALHKIKANVANGETK